MTTDDRRILTIGHSNHPLEVFLDLLARHRVEVLADIRSRPYSRYAPQFDREPLRTALEGAGVRYVFLGDKLGGRPRGAQFYDAGGRVLYERVADSPAFLEGAERLERGIGRYRVAVLCSEEGPAGCHRRLLVGWALGRRGIAIEHIRGDGSLETEEQVSRRGRQDDPQLDLFDDPGEVAWRSIRSVSPRSRPPSSSTP